MKVISLVNFVRGGKSSIARLLAESMGTAILNFDPHRNSEYYNAVKTYNVPENSTITREEGAIVIDTDIDRIEIEVKKDMLICDFGGRFDKRINDFESDIYILPMMDDFESISETVRATKFILNHNPEAKIIHVLNQAMCSSKEERQEFEDGYRAVMSANRLYDVPYLIMPKSRMLKKLVNEKLEKRELVGDSAFLKKGAYRKILDFTDTLIEAIGSEINNSKRSIA